MKVVHVVSNIQAVSDGVADCVRHLAGALTSKMDVEVWALKSTGPEPSDIKVKLHDATKFAGILTPLNKLGVSPQMARGIRDRVKTGDIVHVHSLWMMQNNYAYKAVKGRDVKFCLQTHGMLSPYALSISSWKKKIVLALGQRTALKRADLLIATCDKEYEDIRNFGLKNPVAVIPNGLDLPQLENVEKRKSVVFLGRIHKVKGVDLLVEAWRNIEGKFKDWDLVIAGPTESDYAQGVIAQASKLKAVSFTGEIKGKEKEQLLTQSAVYVLPTHTENFGISVGEALACGTPVVTTTGAPWSGLIENDCGLWIDLSVENLTKALEDMMSRPMDELVRMGQNGRRWVERDFSWDEIARKTIRSYEWLLSYKDVEKPDWIYID